MKMSRALFLAICCFTYASLMACPAAHGQGGYYPRQGSTLVHIRAHIDGRSQLILDDNTAQWEHFDWAAPGRHFSNRGEVEEPTYLNGIAWYPIWPGMPDSENRFCVCDSDIFTGLIPAIPNRPWTAALEVIEGRHQTKIIEQPTAENGYRVVIEFDDNPPGGPAWYEVLLRIGCEVERTCSAAHHSGGSAAAIDLLGSLSVEGNDAWLEVHGAPAYTLGMFFCGTAGAELPFGDAILCVDPSAPGFQRLPPVKTDYAGRAGLRLDLHPAQGSIEVTPGSTWHFQYSFRDAGATDGFRLSDALQATFCP